MSKAKTRRPSQTAVARPQAPRAPASAAEPEGLQIAWLPCVAGTIVGEVTLFVLSNVGLGVANAAFGNAGFQTADGGVVGVATFLSVLLGGYLAARLAGRAGLFQGTVVGIGFIIVGAAFQFAQEASIVHSSLASGSHTLVDLGPMSLGNVFTGDLLALSGGSIGGLLARRR